jgi:hypothetical protein
MASAQDGTTVSSGEQVVVDLFLDTEGAVDLALLGLVFEYDISRFTYDQAASSSASYLLYTDATTPYLRPAGGFCGGPAGGPPGTEGCTLWLLDPTYVALSYHTSSLPLGIPTASQGSEFLARLVFEATGPAGLASFDFIFDSQLNGILQLGDTSRPSLTLGSSVLVNVVPEPATALLVGLGLAGIALTRRH